MTMPKTVKELHLLLWKAIQEWNGDKYVFTANDVEGNGYHWVYFWLETNPKEVKNLDDDGWILNEWFENYENVVILG